jgi:hypothetical protein
MKNQSKTIASVYSRRKRVMDRFYQLGEVEFANSYSGMNVSAFERKILEDRKAEKDILEVEVAMDDSENDVDGS